VCERDEQFVIVVRRVDLSSKLAFTIHHLTSCVHCPSFPSQMVLTSCEKLLAIPRIDDDAVANVVRDVSVSDELELAAEVEAEVAVE